MWGYIPCAGFAGALVRRVVVVCGESADAGDGNLTRLGDGRGVCGERDAEGFVKVGYRLECLGFEEED